jgi:hypothetical protein
VRCKIIKIIGHGREKKRSCFCLNIVDEDIAMGNIIDTKMRKFLFRKEFKGT